MKKIAAKRVNIVSVKLVRESSLLYANRSIRSPDDAYELIKDFLEDRDREHFIVVSLNTKNQPVSINICHIGSLNASLVSPREVMKSAILSSAASIMVFHNHPSGDTSPSQEDISVTSRLKEAGRLMGIDLLDHLIIGDGKYLSLKEKGYI
ncbi:DNA repair protein RadC [Rossellomorea vietnamensis]|uniref:RadC family protein n=1 Tax=Rossellomorea vietnamensis TaxID=218284 RepID=UPI001CCFB2B2|nr:DNA repair protein RadC [Rossellomorea vietnamensis]MCA0151348.1 DNA repair protein RadC [Rossellomorea vietnamensis]